ncbi:hypothetical protein WCT90_03060 [Pectobacterium carotovorum]|nr:hypothetical protein [Pectobacterium carotovorum]MCQ8231357.1 hypothetical protein [Pectobacterium carotovorum]QRN40469.1 hypothetical protein IHJ55_12745 [Pectobacterium carotovorum]
MSAFAASLYLPGQNVLAKVTGCTHSFLAGQAIEDYLAREAWQIAEIEQAIKEADADDFVSSDDDEQSF